MKLTYWYATSRDHTAYNIRCTTKKEVLAALAKYSDVEKYFDPTPKKNVIEYSSAFDLAEKCLGEAHGFERL